MAHKHTCDGVHRIGMNDPCYCRCGATGRIQDDLSMKWRAARKQAKPARAKKSRRSAPKEEQR